MTLIARHSPPALNDSTSSHSLSSSSEKPSRASVEQEIVSHTTSVAHSSRRTSVVHSASSTNMNTLPIVPRRGSAGFGLEEATASDSDVSGFCRDLGIRESESEAFSWIARYGLQQDTLGMRWRLRKDTETQKLVYWDTMSRTTRKDNPLAPSLRAVVGIARMYCHQPSSRFLDDSKERLWLQHKEDLQAWCGPMTDEDGNEYYANRVTGEATRSDPRQDEQYNFEVECALLDTLSQAFGFNRAELQRSSIHSLPAPPHYPPQAGRPSLPPGPPPGFLAPPEKAPAPGSAWGGGYGPGRTPRQEDEMSSRSRESTSSRGDPRERRSTLGKMEKTASNAAESHKHEVEEQRTRLSHKHEKRANRLSSGSETSKEDHAVNDRSSLPIPGMQAKNRGGLFASDESPGSQWISDPTPINSARSMIPDDQASPHTPHDLESQASSPHQKTWQGDERSTPAARHGWQAQGSSSMSLESREESSNGNLERPMSPVFKHKKTAKLEVQHPKAPLPPSSEEHAEPPETNPPQLPRTYTISVYSENQDAPIDTDKAEERENGSPSKSVPPLPPAAISGHAQSDEKHLSPRSNHSPRHHSPRHHSPRTPASPRSHGSSRSTEETQPEVEKEWLAVSKRRGQRQATWSQGQEEKSQANTDGDTQANRRGKTRHATATLHRAASGGTVASSDHDYTPTRIGAVASFKDLFAARKAEFGMSPGRNSTDAVQMSPGRTDTKSPLFQSPTSFRSAVSERSSETGMNDTAVGSALSALRHARANTTAASAHRPGSAPIARLNLAGKCFKDLLKEAKDAKQQAQAQMKSLPEK